MLKGNDGLKIVPVSIENLWYHRTSSTHRHTHFNLSLVTLRYQGAEKLQYGLLLALEKVLRRSIVLGSVHESRTHAVCHAPIDFTDS